MTSYRAGVTEFAQRLTWYATHGVNIYQFLGMEHVDDARKLGPTPKPGGHNPVRKARRAPKKRRSRGTIKPTGGFDIIR